MASRGPARPANLGPQTPPPAYGGAPNGMLSSSTGYPVANNDLDYSDDEEDGSQVGEDDQDLSPINITIKCPLYVHGDSNVIQFDTVSIYLHTFRCVFVESPRAQSLGAHWEAERLFTTRPES
jgi:hypothetical protein